MALTSGNGSSGARATGRRAVSVSAAMPSSPPHAEQYLLVQLRALRRRKWTVALVTLLATAAAVATSQAQTPRYRARADLLIRSSAQSVALGKPGAAQPVSVANEQLVVTSEAVRRKVRARLGTVPPITTTRVAGSDVLTIRAESTHPRKAAAAANAYAAAYIDHKREAAVKELLAAGDKIQPRISELQAQIDAIDRQMAAAPPAQREALGEQLRPQRDRLLSQQAGYKQRFDDLELEASSTGGSAELLTPATAPSRPFSPEPVRAGVLGLGAGLVLGVALALLFEFLDDRIRTREEVERVAGLTVLAMVPPLRKRRRGRKRKKAEVLVSIDDPGSPQAEAFRALRTSIQFLGIERPVRSVQIASAAPQEGKSTTAANLGVALARAGLDVVVLDWDLRRPRLHDFFGLRRDVGYTSVLMGQTPLAQALQPVPDVPNLRVVTSGPIPPNPSELLAGQRAVEVLAELQAAADIVVVDTPAMLPVADAAVVAGRVDATIVVVAARSTTRRGLQRALETLRQVDASVVGAVLNRAGADAGYAYEYDYDYGYRYEVSEKKGGGGRRRRGRRREAEKAAFRI